MGKVVLRVRREGHLLASWTLDERAVEVALVDMATGRELAHVTASGDPARIFQGVDEMPLDRVVRLEGDDFTIPFPEPTHDGDPDVPAPVVRRPPRPVHQLARPTGSPAASPPVPTINLDLLRESGDDLTMPMPDGQRLTVGCGESGDDDEQSLSLPLPEHLSELAGDRPSETLQAELSLPLPEGRLDEIVADFHRSGDAPELSLPLPEATAELSLPLPDSERDAGFGAGANHGGVDGHDATNQYRNGGPRVEQVRGARRRAPIIESPTEPSRPHPRPVHRNPPPPQPAEVWVRKNHEWRSAGHLVGRQRVTLLGGWIRLDDHGNLVVCPGQRLAGSGTLLDGRTVDLVDDPAPVAFPAGSSVVLRQGAHGIYVRSEPPMESTPAVDDASEDTDTLDTGLELGMEPSDALATGVWPSKWHVPR